MVWPAERDGKTIKVGNSLFSLDDKPREMVRYGDSFGEDLQLFCAIKHVEFLDSENELSF